MMPKGPKLRHVVVLIGGTGVIGSAMSDVARKCGLDVLSFSLDRACNDGLYRNCQVDLEAMSPQTLSDSLEMAVQNRPVALILDIIGLDARNAAALADFAVARNAPVGVISSCLLYDHDGSAPIDESCRLVEPNQDSHAYLRDKLSIESFWRSRPDVAWRIFRCQHILGAGSILGCIPNHNRDQNLIARLRAQQPLNLVNFGDIFLSWIHSKDLASAIMTLCSDPTSAHLAINMTAPAPVRARNYYETIAKVMGLPPPSIENFDPISTDFWNLTARNNVFVSRHDCYGQITFVHDLESGIKDALSVPEAQMRNRGHFLRARLLGRGSRKLQSDL